MFRTNTHPQISQIATDQEGTYFRSSPRPLRNLRDLCGKKLTNSISSTTLRRVGLAVLALGCALAAGSSTFSAEPKPDSKSQPLAGTEPLMMEGDIASHLVAGVDKFLLRKIDESVAKRERHWKRDFSSAEAYDKSIEPNRRRLADILGIRDARVKFDAPELVATTKQSALVGKGENYEIYAIRWPVLEDPDPNRSDVIVYGEGLLCVPTGDKKPIADVIAIPDADQTPEQIVGIEDGVAPSSQFARRLAECGFRVVIPVLISRDSTPRNGRATLTNREYLYRGGFEVGRHLIGYEVQKTLACVDWLSSDWRATAAAELKKDGDADSDATPEAKQQREFDRGPPIGVLGNGEGGVIALYASALDTRIRLTTVSAAFGIRNSTWKQPIDRNVFGLLTEFGDAELLAMLAPRGFMFDDANFELRKFGSGGGAPGEIGLPDQYHAVAEFNRAQKTMLPMSITREAEGLKEWGGGYSVAHGMDTDNPDMPKVFIRKTLFNSMISDGGIARRLTGATAKFDFSDSGKLPKRVRQIEKANSRQSRQIAEIDRHTQLVLRESPFVRDQYMKKLYDAANTKDLAAYEKVADEYREKFYNDVIGKFDDPLLPAKPRTRKAYDNEKWTGYEVVLDVFPDVIAYGVLLVPKDLKEGERRPVVVCQHGLEGRPKHVIEGNHDAYHDYAAKLCERGFITFAPQNCYIFEDRFRSLQRKANPLGKTLFSVIVPQHQQITDWLKTLPMVDGERIGFYGLSYGGKSAMRIPPLVKNYCLSICSADFNEWVDKNASTRNPHSYVWSGEYEIFEWDLGSTFNYAEMAALIAPRPFMVERGHFDGVASDETVAHEFAKVRHHYAARMGIGDRCEIEWFVGPHTINGKGTFEFLHKHLKWPEK
jgi:dienelactone hydrolase